MKKIIGAFVGIMIIFVCAKAYSAEPQTAAHKLIVFHSLSCHKCVEAKRTIIPEIEKRFQGEISIEYRNIDNMDDYMFLLGLMEKNKSQIEVKLPVFYFEGKFLNSKGEIKNNLTKLISDSLGAAFKEEDLPRVDLIARFKSFTPLAIISVGLLDGINPCAFTVIVFFISFLALQGYRKRELLIIGLSFITAVGLTYTLIGLGLLGFLYELKGFWLAAKILNICIGIFSIVLGVFSIHDFFKFKRTYKTEGLLLQLPTAVKNQIHKVVGAHYRKSKDPEAEKRHILSLLISAFVTGFLVSLLEAVCTGQTYLPTCAFILKTTHLKLEALGYLLLYNLMFIVPLLMIFLLALLGVTSEQFSGFLKKHLLTIKVLLAILFFSLGIFLIWRA